MARSNVHNLESEFQRLQHLDSKTLIEIPEAQIIEPADYRSWLLTLEERWMQEFNGDSHYRARMEFNTEAPLYGNFENISRYCKLYRGDGSLKYNDYRGFLFRDHYNKNALVDVHAIADNLIRFLRQEGIGHQRTDFPKLQ